MADGAVENRINGTEGDSKPMASLSDDTTIDDTPESTLVRSGSERGYFADDDQSSDRGDICEEERLLTNGYTVESERVGLFNKPSSLSTIKKTILGLVIVVIIALSWVGSTQTAQSTYNGQFKAPFFIVWFGTAWMMLVFPLTLPIYCFAKRSVSFETLREGWSHSKEIISPPQFNPLSLLTSTIMFTFIWIPTNYMYVRALMNIAATDVTALFSTAPTFVFLFSMCVLREPPLILRLVAVLLAMGGISLFAYVDGFASANVIGILLSVGSAIGAALYKTLLKWRAKEATIYQMALFLSSIGLFSTLTLWPVFILLDLFGAEPIVAIPWGYLCGSSALSVIFNFAINFGIAYTFPLFISLGTVLGIPLNAVADALFRGVDLVNWKITAMDLIIGGFLLMLASPSISHWIQRLLCCRACLRGAESKHCGRGTCCLLPR